MKYQMQYKLFLIFSIIIFFNLPELNSQDISAFKKSKPVKVNGSFNGSASYFNSGQNSNSPFGYNMGASLNFNFFNIFQVPLNFAYSDYQTSFSTTSFKRFGISPSYKWIKLHGGYRSFSISQYLASGSTILGGGLELSPKNFNLLVFGGELKENYTIEQNSFPELENYDIKFYKRMMYGIKLSFGKPQNRISLMGFKSKDKINSGSTDTLLKYKYYPKENFGFGIETNNTFFKIVTLQTNIATSVNTPNAFGDSLETDINTQKWLNRIKIITSVNNTSRYAFAYDAKLGVRINKFNIGLKYQHIDPFFSSIGVSFLQQNIENYLIDLNGNFLKGKFSFFANSGIQYYNNSGFTGQRQRKLALSANLNWNLNEKINLNAGYNNFVQNSDPKISEIVDSFRITTNNSGFNGSLNYKPAKKSPHLLSLYFSDQQFDLVNGDVITSSSSSINSNLNYKYSSKNKWTFGGGLQFQKTSITGAYATQRYGILLNASIPLIKNLNFRTNSGFRFNTTDNTKDGFVFNFGSNLDWTIAKSHKITFSSSWMLRKTTKLKSKNEYRMRLGYNFYF